MAPKRKGGVRQRIQAADEEEAIETGTSCLAKHLVDKFLWGELSAQQAQALASCAKADLESTSDGKCMPDLRDLAKIGNYGKQTQNCFRDLMLQLEFKARLPAPYVAKLPFKAPVGEQDQHFLLPHELFSSMYHNYNDKFHECIAPPHEVSRFWEEISAGDPSFRSHPARDRAHFAERCVPIACHGDDVPIVGIGKGWTSKMSVFSWCSLLSLNLSTAHRMFLMYAVFDKMRARSETANTIHGWLRIFTWSLWWLWQGVWPDADENGKKFLGFSLGMEFLSA